MAEARISQKELKRPDRFETWLYGLAQIIYKNSQGFTAAGIAIVVLIGAGFAGFQYYQAEQIKQANLFYQAQKDLHNMSIVENQRDAQAARALEFLVKEYPDVTQTVLAYTYLGGIYGRQKQWAQAETAYRTAIEHPKALPSVANGARLSLAQLLINQKKWDEAQKTLEAITDHNWQDLQLRALAQLALAMGDQAGAKAHLEKLIATVPDSAFKAEAESLLLTLN